MCTLWLFYCAIEQQCYWSTVKSIIYDSFVLFFLKEIFCHVEFIMPLSYIKGVLTFADFSRNLLRKYHK